MTSADEERTEDDLAVDEEQGEEVKGGAIMPPKKSPDKSTKDTIEVESFSFGVDKPQ